ncbi:hypothetical protein BD413DRAFT_136987 [Trametes elegans]|nr:hypothetical protein BD413DRAFT_136987 [Trametes elegans]
MAALASPKHLCARHADGPGLLATELLARASPKFSSRALGLAALGSPASASYLRLWVQLTAARFSAKPLPTLQTTRRNFAAVVHGAILASRPARLASPPPPPLCFVPQTADPAPRTPAGCMRATIGAHLPSDRASPSTRSKSSQWPPALVALSSRDIPPKVSYDTDGGKGARPPRLGHLHVQPPVLFPRTHKSTTARHSSASASDAVRPCVRPRIDHFRLSTCLCPTRLLHACLPFFLPFFLSVREPGPTRRYAGRGCDRPRPPPGNVEEAPKGAAGPSGSHSSGAPAKFRP